MRRSSVLQQALDARRGSFLRWEGRRHVAEALGLAAVSADVEVTSASCPASAKAGTRCLALDVVVLAEVCSLLCLDAAPWPPARTKSSRAERMLAIIGALDCAALVPKPGCLDTASGEILSRLVSMLSAVAQRRQVAALSSKRATRRCNGRSTSQTYGWNSHRLDSSTRFQSVSRSALRPRDEVLAHWALPDGEPSRSLEEAVVLSTDPSSGRTRLRYVDGMELVVPSSWISQRRPPGNHECSSDALQPVDLESPSGISGFVPVLDCDYPLERLIRGACSPAEICARARCLCARPRGAGLALLAAAVAAALPCAPEQGQQNCVEALCALCSGGGGDAESARAMANAILLSNCGQIACTPWQLSTLRSAPALSDTQRNKLLALARPDGWLSAWA